MVGDDILCEIEPEAGHLCENGALLHDLVLQDHVKRGNPVGRYHDELVADVVDLAYLAFLDGGIFLHASFPPMNCLRIQCAFCIALWYSALEAVPAGDLPPAGRFFNEHFFSIIIFGCKTIVFMHRNRDLTDITEEYLHNFQSKYST